MDFPTAPTADAANATQTYRPSRWAERLSFVLFWGIHVGCFAAIWTGVSVKSVVLAIALYWIRMFGITAGYHRYFSHKSYKTSRLFQLFLAILGTSSIQKGPLWWAATHRKHHRFSDTPQDTHSPRQHGFWYSHVGWISGGDHIETDLKTVKDLTRYPELIWLTKYHWVPPLLLGIACYLFDGWTGLVVAMGWSTVLVWHCTFTINSLSHVFGRVRYQTGDDSKNNWFLAIITMGEGWHNNHHHYMHSANQGFFWWEYDLSYYILKGLSTVGIVWDLRKPPVEVIAVAGAPSAAAIPTVAMSSSEVRPAANDMAGGLPEVA